jgi:hypothetical protein
MTKAKEVAKVKYEKNALQWVSVILFLVSMLLLGLSIGEPVGWKIVIGVVLLNRASYVEMRYNVLQEKYNQLLNEL